MKLGEAIALALLGPLAALFLGPGFELRHLPVCALLASLLALVRGGRVLNVAVALGLFLPVAAALRDLAWGEVELLAGVPALLVASGGIMVALRGRLALPLALVLAVAVVAAALLSTGLLANADVARSAVNRDAAVTGLLLLLAATGAFFIASPVAAGKGRLVLAVLLCLAAAQTGWRYLSFLGSRDGGVESAERFLRLRWQLGVDRDHRLALAAADRYREAGELDAARLLYDDALVRGRSASRARSGLAAVTLAEGEGAEARWQLYALLESGEFDGGFPPELAAPLADAADRLGEHSLADRALAVAGNAGATLRRARAEFRPPPGIGAGPGRLASFRRIEPERGSVSPGGELAVAVEWRLQRSPWSVDDACVVMVGSTSSFALAPLAPLWPVAPGDLGELRELRVRERLPASLPTGRYQLQAGWCRRLGSDPGLVQGETVGSVVVQPALRRSPLAVRQLAKVEPRARWLRKASAAGPGAPLEIELEIPPGSERILVLHALAFATHVPDRAEVARLEVVGTVGKVLAERTLVAGLDTADTWRAEPGRRFEHAAPPPAIAKLVEHDGERFDAGTWLTELALPAGAKRLRVEYLEAIGVLNVEDLGYAPGAVRGGDE